MHRFARDRDESSSTAQVMSSIHGEAKILTVSPQTLEGQPFGASCQNPFFPRFILRSG